MNSSKKMLEMNRIHMEKLGEEHEALITDIALYMRVKLNASDAEEAINDILAMLLEAQNRGEDVAEVFGVDYRVFCDEVVRSYKNNNKLYGLTDLWEAIKLAMAMLPFFIALNCLVGIGKIKPLTLDSLWAKGFDLTPVPIIGGLLAVPIAYLILNYIANDHRSHNDKKDFAVFFGIQLTFILLMVGIGLVLRHVVWITLPHYTVWLVLSLVFLMGYGIYFKGTLKDVKPKQEGGRLS